MDVTQNSSSNSNLQNARWNICDKVKKTRYSKIRQEKEGHSYFKSYNYRIYLDECMRAGH